MKFHKTNNGRICRTFKDDCVVRSVSLATDQNYRQTFEDLMALGLEVGAYPNHDKVWIRYLEDRGFVKNKPPRLNGKLIKLENWSDHPQVAVVRNSRHLTAIVDGILHDEWDCRYRPVNSYWTKEQAS